MTKSILTLLAFILACTLPAFAQEAPEEEVIDEEIAEEAIEVDPCEAPVKSYIEREMKKKYPQGQEEIYAGVHSLSEGFSFWSFDYPDLDAEIVAKVAILAKTNPERTSCAVVSGATDFTAAVEWPVAAVAANDACGKAVLAAIKKELKQEFPDMPLSIASTSIGAKLSDGHEEWNFKFQGGAIAVESKAIVKRGRTCSVVASSYAEAD